MKISISGCVFAALVFTCASASAKEVSLWRDSVRITVPSYAKQKKFSGGVAFLLPKEGGFSPNTNVMRQKFGKNIRAYARLSRKQLAQAGYQITRQRFQKNYVWDVSYKGSVNGRSLFFFARAFKTRAGIILGTATTPYLRSTSADVIVAMVDSIQVRR